MLALGSLSCYASADDVIRAAGRLAERIIPAATQKWNEARKKTSN